MMGVVFRGYGRWRWRRLFVRALPIAVCVIGAGVLLALPFGDDMDQGNLKEVPILALLFTAATNFLWWHADGEGSAALKFRRTVRRIAYRCALGLVYLGFAAFWLASYAQFEGTDEPSTTNLLTDASHFETYGDLRTALMLAGVALALAEPLLWRAWPWRVRASVNEALNQKALADVNQEWVKETTRLFGYAGSRPRPVVSESAGKPSPEPVRLQPTLSEARRSRQLRAKDEPRADDWFTFALLAWDGECLTVRDARYDLWDLPLSRVSGDWRHILSIVWWGERRTEIELPGLPGPVAHDWIFFVSAGDQQYARIPGLGFTPEGVARIAAAAGLRYARYEVDGGPARGTPIPFRYFHPRRDTVILEYW